MHLALEKNTFCFWRAELIWMILLQTKVTFIFIAFLRTGNQGNHHIKLSHHSLLTQHWHCQSFSHGFYFYVTANRFIRTSKQRQKSWDMILQTLYRPVIYAEFLKGQSLHSRNLLLLLHRRALRACPVKLQWTGVRKRERVSLSKGLFPKSGINHWSMAAV